MQLKAVVRSVLLRKIEDLKHQHTLTLNAFLAAVAEILPQVNQIAENVFGGTTSEMKLSTATAWEVLMWISESCVDVDNESGWHVWDTPGYLALLKLDLLFEKVLQMRIELAPAALGADLVPMRYAQTETGWTELDLYRLDWVAEVLDGNAIRMPATFLDHTRCEMRAFVGHAAEQRERGMRHMQLKIRQELG